MATSESTTQASAWRLHLARGIGDVNGSHRNVTAVAVVGSVSRGTADRYSDLEIATFWRVPPTEEERHALASQAGGANWRSFPWNDLGTEEWSDDYELNGLKIDGLHYTVVTAERLLADVLERFDTSLPRQLFAGSVHHARVLHGEQLIQGWQARTADYPVELARAMVREKWSKICRRSRPEECANAWRKDARRSMRLWPIRTETERACGTRHNVVPHVVRKEWRRT